LYSHKHLSETAPFTCDWPTYRCGSWTGEGNWIEDSQLIFTLPNMSTADLGSNTNVFESI